MTHSIYDDLADRYDDRYGSENCPQCLREDLEALRIVTEGNPHIHSLLDLGCGTGLALDLGMLNGKPSGYVGVDPSDGMLRMLKQKHPWVHELFNERAEDYLDRNPRVFHTVISLFGAPSYIEAETIGKLLTVTGKRLVLMHYREGYFPDYYDWTTEERTPPKTADASREAAAALPGAEVSFMNNMQITVVNR